MPRDIRVGFDVGGTFTDIIVAEAGGAIHTYKILSTPDEIGRNVASCIGDALSKSPEGKIAGLVHATTVASNAMVEGKTAVTGLITTKGFRDEVEIPRAGRLRSTGMTLGLSWPGTAPLIPRRRRREVTERMTAQGTVDTPLDLVEAKEAIEFLVHEGTEAIAISFINSFVDPSHELEVAQLVHDLVPDMPVSISHVVLPEMREYERTSTTVLHASLSPVIGRYLDEVESELRPFYPSLLTMQPNGGVVPAAHARRRPANLIESGPAAGVLAAASLTRLLGIDLAVSLDMGGTTVKACLIEHGQPRETVQMEVSTDPETRLARGAGHALRMTGSDIVEIGAGGGSIAWVDAGGALRIGPRSAGALPGPACYGRGGTAPTITDANVVLGYLNPKAIAGGTVPILHGAAANAIQDQIADPLKISLEDAAFGIHRVANATMMRAVRAVTVERGRDPRECALIVFGGAGPIHAAALAANLDISEVYVPLYPGLFSALGLLMADMRFDYVRAAPGPLDQLSGSDLLGKFQTLEDTARHDLIENSIDPGAVSFHRSVDLRYPGQASELTLAVPPEVEVVDLPRILTEQFHLEHERAFGYSRSGEGVILASIRLKVIATQGSVSFGELAGAFSEPDARIAAGVEARTAYFGPDLGVQAVPVLLRAELKGNDVEGPAIIEEFDSTVVVPPGWTAGLDDFANIVLRANQDSGSKRKA